MYIQEILYIILLEYCFLSHLNVVELEIAPFENPT